MSYFPSHERPGQLPPVPDETALFLPPAERGNRKEKSLGLLAERMLQNYPFMLEPGNPTQIHLDDTARMLNTERRRIYDIVNVLEAVQMMSKVSIEVFNDSSKFLSVFLFRICKVRNILGFLDSDSSL